MEIMYNNAHLQGLDIYVIHTLSYKKYIFVQYKFTGKYQKQLGYK